MLKHSQRNFSDGSEKEPVYSLSDCDILPGEAAGEMGEPYVLLSRDFSENEIALVYHLKPIIIKLLFQEK